MDFHSVITPRANKQEITNMIPEIFPKWKKTKAKPAMSIKRTYKHHAAALCSSVVNLSKRTMRFTGESSAIFTSKGGQNAKIQTAISRVQSRGAVRICVIAMKEAAAREADIVENVCCRRIQPF